MTSTTEIERVLDHSFRAAIPNSWRRGRHARREVGDLSIRDPNAAISTSKNDLNCRWSDRALVLALFERGSPRPVACAAAFAGLMTTRRRVVRQFRIGIAGHTPLHTPLTPACRTREIAKYSGARTGRSTSVVTGSLARGDRILPRLARASFNPRTRAGLEQCVRDRPTTVRDGRASAVTNASTRIRLACRRARSLAWLGDRGLRSVPELFLSICQRRSHRRYPRCDRTGYRAESRHARRATHAVSTRAPHAQREARSRFPSTAGPRARVVARAAPEPQACKTRSQG
jgi:hypothetical protein